jgi:hypothetical protein
MSKLSIGVVGAVAILIVGYIALNYGAPKREAAVLDSTPYDATVAGTYGCLPHRDTTGPQTDECAFGLHADTGEWYAVNFGASAQAAEQFRSGAHVKVQGNIVIKEALSSDHWQKYDMKGIFTVNETLESSSSTPTSGGSAKININAVCEGALAYMTFPSGDEADRFVSECKEGKHPEVIEKYKADMQVDGAAI